VINIRRLGLEVGAAMGTLDSGIGLAEIFVGVRGQVLEEIMTPQTCLGQTLETTVGVRADKFTSSILKLVWVLGGHVIIQSLPSRALVCTMLALVLEGTRMLSLDVHVNGALVLLDEGTMRALKLTGLGANVFEGHGWGLTETGRGNFQFFCCLLSDIRFFA